MFLAHNGCLWNHTMKKFQVRYGQCENIIFHETFTIGSSKYLLDLPLGDKTGFFLQDLESIHKF